MSCTPGASVEAITAKVREDAGINVEPMPLAALLLRKTIETSARRTRRGRVGELPAAAR
jgi:hypothetical protein